MISDYYEVKKFLSQVKQVMNKINSFHLAKREKNMNSLNKHGLSIDIVKYYIKNLKVEHYCKGPCDDDKEENKFKWWFFGRKINNIMFYIKIRIITKDRHQVICLSFHEAEYKMENFPYE